MPLGNVIDYVKYIKKNYPALLQRTDEILNGRKELLKVLVIENISIQVRGPLYHYKWVRGGNPYDNSGHLIADGRIPLETSVTDFLKNEYSGAYYESPKEGEMIYYAKYADTLIKWCTDEIGDEVIKTAIDEMIYNQFGEEISEGDYMIIEQNCYDYICESCTAGRLTYDIDTIISFFDLEGATLMDFVEKDSKRSIDPKERRRKRLERMNARKYMSPI